MINNKKENQSNEIDTPETAKYGEYLSDGTDVEDEFGIHSKMAEAICEKIVWADVSQNPLTFGLFGEWGSGKSVIIEILRKKIGERKEKDIAFINIDVWKYNGIPLLKHVLYEIAKQAPTKEFNNKEKGNIIVDIERGVSIGRPLEEHFPNSYMRTRKKIQFLKWLALAIFLVSLLFLPKFEFGSNFNSIVYSLTLTTTVLGFGVDKIWGSFFGAASAWANKVSEKMLVMDKTIIPNISPEQFEKEFDRLISELSNYKGKGIKKYVIVFDNVDRCKGDFAYEVLSTIKTYMNKEKCIYIIPCDDFAIKHYLDNEYNAIDSDKENRNFSAEFLDKLFNTYVRVPRTSEMARDKFIEKCLSKTSAFSEIPQRGKIVEILYYAYKGENPRQIKKYINDLIFYYEIALKVDGKRKFLLDDMQVFAMMMAIKQVFPEFENALINNPNLIREIESESSDFYEVKELIIKTHFKFPSDKSVLSYIYLDETPKDLAFIEQVRNAETIELSNYNMLAVERALVADVGKSAFFQNEINSIILSIINDGVSDFIEEKTKNSRPADKLYKTLKLNIKTDNIFEFLQKNPQLNENELGEFLYLYDDLVADIEEKYNLFLKTKTLKNHETFLEEWITAEYLDFDKCIGKFLLEKAMQEKDESISQMNPLLTEELRILLKKLMDNKRIGLIESSLIQRIVPLIKYDNEAWRDIEREMIINLDDDIVHIKIAGIIQEIIPLIDRYGIKISENTEDISRKLDYLASFLELPINKLKIEEEREALRDLKQVFEEKLIKLSGVREQSGKIFELATKIYGNEFVNENFKQGTIFYEDKKRMLEAISKDIELLEILTEAETFKSEIHEDLELRKKIMEITDTNWQLANIDIFVTNPLDDAIFKEFYKNENWSEMDKIKILRKLISQMILTLENYSNKQGVSKEKIIELLDYVLTITKDEKLDKKLLEDGKKTFEKITKEELSTSIEILKAFSTYSNVEKEYLEMILNCIANSESIHAIELQEEAYIIGMLGYAMEETFSKKMCEKFIDVANKESIIEIGLRVLEEFDNDMIEEYRDKLLLIKEKGTNQESVTRLIERIEEELSVE